MSAEAFDILGDPASTEAQRGYAKSLLNAQYARGIQYKGGVFPAIQPGDLVDINSLYPADLTARLAESYPPMAVELPTFAECPLHGPDCEAWA